MKKLLALVATVLVVVVFQSCEEKNGKSYHIEGTTDESDTASMVFIKKYKDTTVIATAIVKNHKFILDGTLEEPTMVIVGSNENSWMLIVEEENYVLSPDEDFAQGGTLNTELAKFYATIDSLDTIEDASAQQDGYRKIIDIYWKRHKNDVLGAYITLISTYSLGIEYTDTLLHTAGEKIQNNNILQMVKRNIENAKRSNKGMMFTDITLNTIDGKSTKLSKYVGKGKYVVMDCWASWCPPCRRLIPELKKLHSEYKNKGLEIIGVATRDKIDDTKKAIEELQVPWVVLSDDNLKINIRDVYGFEGIPFMIIFGPDGKIVARNPNEKDIPNIIRTK